MKIQFIICGWWFDKFDGKTNQTAFIESLLELKNYNKSVEVFWACHKEPPTIVSENFEYEVYENIGLEWGAYDKGFNTLSPDDETFLFFIQDDMVIYDWDFINICISAIQSGIAVIGNGFNYPYELAPLTEARLSYWLKNTNTWKDYVKEENKQLFTENINCLSIRGSFLATKGKYIREIGGFEYIDRPLEKGVKEDGSCFLLIDPYGNTALYLNAYKFTKILTPNRMRWLSNTYRRSKWMTECGRGNIDLPQDSQTQPFNVPPNFIL